MTRSGIVTACAFALAALPLAAILNIWQDEAFTLHTTAAGIVYAFREALAFEQSAPLYFMLIAALRHAGSAIWYLRSFSIACMVATILSVAPLARRYLPAIDPIYPTLVIAVNPLAMWAALEMRPYALIALFSALVLLAFYDAFCTPNRSFRAAIVFVAVGTLALYTQFYLAFLMLGLSVALCIYERRGLPALLASGAAIALLFVPMLFIVPGQVANFRAPFPHPTLALSFASIAFPMARFVLPALVPAKLLVLVVGVAVAAVAWRSSWGVRSPKWMLPVATLTAALSFALVTNGAHVLVLSRHTTSLYVPSVLSLFAVIANARAPVTVLVRTWTAIAMVAATIALVVTYRPLAKPGDWIRVSRFVQERERAGEPIAVFEAENALPFAHYYRGPNAVVPVPAGVDFRRYDLSAFIVRTPSELVRTFPSKQQRVWLLRSGDCQADGVSYGCNIVDAYVHGRYRTLISRDFYDAHVLLLEKIDKRPTS